MAIRLQQMHPAFVHLPIALLPLAVGADLLGCMSGNKSLLSFGQKAIGIAAAGAVGSAVTGLIAGEEVNVEGATHDMLVTHRDLNFVATVVAGCMAFWRAEHDRPNAAYLGTGAAGIGILAYTAYLGGTLVYDSGVGVQPCARGLSRRRTGVAGRTSRCVLQDGRSRPRGRCATYDPRVAERAVCPGDRGLVWKALRRMSTRIPAGNVRLKRAYEAPAAEDGTQILIDRLWPRGVSKADAALDQWMKDIAPSTELRKWFGHDPARWKEFCRRYGAEVHQNAALLGQLRALARQGPVTLVYSAHDEVHNDAVVLRDLLLGR